MSRPQQRRPPDVKHSQNFDRLAGGKTIGPYANSGDPKGKRAPGNRKSPVSRVQRVSGEPQIPSKAGELSPWGRVGSTARLKSAWSSPVQHPLDTRETACSCTRINGCICADYTPTPSACEQSQREATKNQIRPESTSQPTTTPNDTAKPRFYCLEPECSVSCSRDSDRIRHQKSQHGDSTFECSYPGCQFRHPRRDKVLKHTREDHSSRPINCPAIVYNFPSAAEEVNTLQKGSRDQVNASKRPGFGVSRSDLRTPGHQRNGKTASTATRFGVLDAETAAPDQRKPSGRVDAVARTRSPRTPASRHSDPKVRHFAVQRSQSLPRNSTSGVNPPASKQTTVRTAVGQLEYAAKRRYGGPLVRPVSTPPKLSTVAPGHLNSSFHPQCITSPHRRTAQPSALSSNSSSLHQLGGGGQPLNVGGSGRSPAPPQHPGGSWADVVRNASNGTSSSATVLPNNTENKDDASGGQVKGKRRKLNEEEEEFFVCIGHHRGRSDLDETLECATMLKVYFSQLERHHERHGWFYCARCGETFADADGRKAHRNGQRCHMRCVTKGCTKYGTCPPFKCKHFGKDSDSGEAVWSEFFRHYRSGEEVPSPKIRRPPVSMQLDRPAGPSRLEVVSSPTPVSPGRVVSPSSAGDYASPAATSVTGAIDTSLPSGTRSRMLLTLADNLWRLIHRDNVLLPTWIIQDYEVAMGSSMRLAQVQECDHPAVVLELFVQRLWSWAQADIERSGEQYAQLLTYAQYWLHYSATIVNAFESSVPNLSSGSAPSGLPSLGGFGQQFQANPHPGHAPSVQGVLPQQQYFAATHRGGSIQDQTHDPPWLPPQDGARTQHHGFHPLGVPADLTPQSNGQQEGFSQLDGATNSETMSSFNYVSRPDTNTRNYADSTNPTSVHALNTRRNEAGIINRLATSEQSHPASFHGSNTPSIEFSQDGKMDPFDLNKFDQNNFFG